MNVGKPNRVCHFGSAGCQYWGAAVVKTMTFLFASMSLAEPKRCPVDLVLAVGGNTNREKGQTVGKRKKQNKTERAIIVKRGRVK